MKTKIIVKVDQAEEEEEEEEEEEDAEGEIKIQVQVPVLNTGLQPNIVDTDTISTNLGNLTRVSIQKEVPTSIVIGRKQH